MTLDEKLRKSEEFLMKYQGTLDATRKIIGDYIQYITKLKPMEEEKNEQLRQEFLKKLTEVSDSAKNISDLISQTLNLIGKSLTKFDELSAQLVEKERMLNSIEVTIKKFVEIIRREPKYQLLCIIQEHDSILINDLAKLSGMDQDELSNNLRALQSLDYIKIQGDIIISNKEIPKLIDL